MLHIDFAPPKLTTLGQTDSQALIEGFKTLGDKFKPGETLAELKRPLPIVGSTATPQKNDPPTLQVTLGSLTGIDQRYGQLFKAISNYLVANSGAKLSDLSEFIDSYAGVNKVSWTENEGELLFTVEFDANTSTTRDLFVGYKAGREGLEIRPDSNDKITLQSKFDSTFTFGLDRTQLNNPQKAFQFGVSELFVESTGKILEVANVEFPVKLGLLDSVAKKVTADFEAKAESALHRPSPPHLGTIEFQAAQRVAQCRAIRTCESCSTNRFRVSWRSDKQCRTLSTRRLCRRSSLGLRCRRSMPFRLAQLWS